ncbi:MAG: glycosyltransferase [Geminicoccaceae bacterium]
MPLRNTAALVAEAIKSVLDQRGCVLEVLISDDASEDGTLDEATRTVAADLGPHQVVVLRADQRLGIDHLQHLVDRASCRLLIEAHGDDVSLPGRMARLIAVYRETGASLITSLVHYRHGDDGPLEPQPFPPLLAPGWIGMEALVMDNPGVLSGARYAFDSAVHDRFTRLDSSYLPAGHDVLQAFRATLLTGVWYTAERLLQYRLHPGQGSMLLADRRSPAAAKFGWSLRRLAVVRAMGRDLDHAEAKALVDPTQASIARGVLARATSELLDRMLDSRDDLLRAGRQALWVNEHEFGLANRNRLGSYLADRAALTGPALDILLKFRTRFRQYRSSYLGRRPWIR